MTDRTDDSIWRATAVWAGITTVLIVVTLTLDPLWSYYGSWAAGFMTGICAVGAGFSKIRRYIRDTEDEALLLEVRQATTEEVEQHGDDVEH